MVGVTISKLWAPPFHNYFHWILKHALKSSQTRKHAIESLEAPPSVPLKIQNKTLVLTRSSYVVIETSNKEIIRVILEFCKVDLIFSFPHSTFAKPEE